MVSHSRRISPTPQERRFPATFLLVGDTHKRELPSFGGVCDSFSFHYLFLNGWVCLLCIKRCTVDRYPSPIQACIFLGNPDGIQTETLTSARKQPLDPLLYIQSQVPCPHHSAATVMRSPPPPSPWTTWPNWQSGQEEVRHSLLRFPFAGGRMRWMHLHTLRLLLRLVQHQFTRLCTLEPRGLFR